MAPDDADWSGLRGWRDLKECRAEDAEEATCCLGFTYEFHEEPEKSLGKHLWIYTEEDGEPDRVAHLVQKFLQRFRPAECWSLTYSRTCSRPHLGAFGGGAVFVTADAVKWSTLRDIVERTRKAFEQKKHQAGPHNEEHNARTSK